MVFMCGIKAWRLKSSSVCKFPSHPMRTFFSSVQVREDPSKPPFFPSRPGPLPLGDKEQQREMEELIRRVESELESSPVTMAEAARRDNEKINPEATPEDPLPSFENDINPETQEVGGPKGKEPTRYGDWERKGRVFDF
ncbi:hypothetical protein DSO57_1007086 [Entomophthora muscae]|uniref:Uncharacterized protein n=1 Tax=Entomophthora muscae TaxID=34485 RepID=A0ACC2TUD0_9FUNG|nr:hypothetical protein DSO57_1007086 [Entomophthora muscae]